jgi:hypothetical protein
MFLLLDKLPRRFVCIFPPCLALVAEAPHASTCPCDNGMPGVLMTAVATAVQVRYLILCSWYSLPPCTDCGVC